MKFSYLVLVLSALAVSTGAGASRAVPTASGTVSTVKSSGSETMVTINGRTYSVSPRTRFSNAGGRVQPGQTVTFVLADDGQTVLLVQPAEKNAKQP